MITAVCSTPSCAGRPDEGIYNSALIPNTKAGRVKSFDSMRKKVKEHRKTHFVTRRRINRRYRHLQTVLVLSHKIDERHEAMNPEHRISQQGQEEVVDGLKL